MLICKTSKHRWRIRPQYITIIMQKQQSVQHNNQNPEIRIHELLTKYIHQFSQLLHSAMKLLVMLEDNHPLMHNDIYTSFHDKISTSIYNLQRYDNYRGKLGERGLANNTTCKRFLCRIVENMLHFKNLAQGSQVYLLAVELICNFQTAICGLQHTNNIAAFVSDVYKCYLQFLTSVKKKLTKQQRRTQSKKPELEKTSQQKNLVSTTRDLRSKSFQIQPEYQRKMRKLISNVNGRFKTLDCMDIDYSYFRNTFSQAREMGKEFFEDYMERNNTIDAQIKDYQKDYQQYIRRKDRRKTQKSLRLTLVNQKSGLGKKYNRQQDSSVYLDRRVSLKTNNWASDKDKTNRVDKKKFSLIDESSAFTIHQLKEKQHNKIKYDIKNVMITASKLKMEPFANAQKTNIKNTLRHLEVSRRKYFKVEQKSFLKNLRQLTEKLQSPSRK